MNLIVNRRDFEICDQPHKMYAEGCQDDPLNEKMIEFALLREGFAAKNISIWTDTFQHLIRWSADIERINPPTTRPMGE